MPHQLLSIVISQGSPAQIALASSLLAELEVKPQSTDALDAASALFEAFMHDPHLTRFENV